MPKQQLKNLITHLHDTFAPGQASTLQQQWMSELQRHAHNPGEPEPSDPTPQDAANLLLESLEADHPQAAGVLREIIATLGRLGL
jgi:plasmid stabilization system protein ParE